MSNLYKINPYVDGRDHTDDNCYDDGSGSGRGDGYGSGYGYGDGSGDG